MSGFFDANARPEGVLGHAEEAPKALFDENLKTILFAAPVRIGYFYVTVRALRRGIGPAGKAARGEELTPAEARRVVRLLSWAPYIVAANVAAAVEDTRVIYRAVDALAEARKARAAAAREEKERSLEERRRKVGEAAERLAAYYRKKGAAGGAFDRAASDAAAAAEDEKREGAEQ